MATLLRYAKYLRQTPGLGRRLNIVHNHVEASSPGRIFLQHHQVPQLTTGYATKSGLQLSQSIEGYEKSFQNLELQLRRSGRATKPDIIKILGEIELAGNVPSLEGLLLVRCCGKPLIDRNSSESIELVNDVWKTLEKFKVPLDVSHYNALLNVYLEKNYKFEPNDFMNLMINNGIELNRVSYQRLIAGYCQIGDIEGATKILGIMHEKNIPICENIFNSLIIGHSEADDMESAIGILKTMENAGIQHSSDTYAALFNAYAKRGDIESINESQNNLNKLELKLQDNQIVDIIITLSENGHIDKAYNYSKNLNRLITSDTEIGRLLIRLIDIKQIDLAIELLKSTANEPTRHKIRSTFLIRSMSCHKDYTSDEIINICRILEDENLNKRALVFALYNTLTNDNMNNNDIIERSINIMKAYSKRNGEIRDHYFWPLFKKHSNENNIDGIYDIIKIMINDFNIIPSLNTLRDFVLPYMFGTYENIMESLLQLNIPKDTITQAILARLIYERKLRNAAILITSYPGKYSKDIFLKPMVESLNYRDDVKSFVILLRFLTKTNDDNCNFDNTSIEIIDDALKECLVSISTFKNKIISQLIEELVESGLSISTNVANDLRQVLSNKLTPEIDNCINKLSSGELEQVPMKQYNPFLNSTISKNNNSFSMIDLRRQFSYNIENKDNKAIEEILEKMEKSGYSSAAVYAQAISMFCDNNNFEGATKCIKLFDSKYPTGKLDHTKILKYATLLIKNDRFDDAIKFITDKPIPQNDEKKSRGVSGRVRDLLDAVVDTKHVDNLHQLFNFLTSKNYIHFDNYVLGPLVKIHVQRDDLQKGLEAFERICIEYKLTPYKNVLAIKFIETEDANSLQKLTDLCTELHGESNALVDLSLIFLECGRVKQAKKILETSGIQVFNNKIINAVEKFSKLNRYDCLEQLTKITRGVDRLDRAILYNNLLEIYNDKNDWKKGLSLWTEMQEDDVQPTSYFLNLLGNLLKKNNQIVPFTYGNEKLNNNQTKLLIKPNSNESTITNDSRKPIRQSKIDENLNEAISRKDWVQAEDICRNPSTSKIEIKIKLGKLIRVLIENDEIDRALILTRSLIQKKYGIRNFLFGELCDKLIDMKRFNDVEEFGNILDEQMSIDLDYYKILSKVNILKHGVKHLIDNTKINISNDDKRSFEKYIHFGELTHSLLRDPSILSEFELWAENIADKGVTRGMQALWNFYFINKSPKADELWDKYISTNKSPLIRPVIDVAKTTKNPLLIERLIQKLDQHPQLNINSKCRAYAGLISTYNSMEQFDDALNVLKNVTKRYRIGLFSRKVLVELKNGLEKSGKSFPYNLNTQANPSDESEERLEETAKI